MQRFQPLASRLEDAVKSVHFAVITLACIAGITAMAADANAQIVSPTGTYPPPFGVPVFDLSNDYGRQQYAMYMHKQHMMVRLQPIYAQHIGERAWVRSWQYLLAGNGIGDPIVAENDDVMGLDNDGLGSPEPVFVEGYFESDGSYVRSQFRALPGFGERGP